MRGIAVLCRLLVFLASFALQDSRADDIGVRAARLDLTDEGLVLNAEFEFEINPRLGEAVASGVPLYFVVDFELIRSRWYWFDEKTVSRRMQLRLSYHAISRQYRLSSGPLHQSFTTLAEALNVMQRVRNWQVADRSALTADTFYEAAVRMRLDTALLPKPFQVSALTSRDWNLESAWRRFPYRHGAAPAPVESREVKREPEDTR
jgi:Domain of unknown function (DUF4390)